MPKEFSEWVGSMANSIEDGSLVDAFIGDKLTALQRRMLIADMLSPYPHNEKEVDDWVTAFTVDLDDGDVGHRAVSTMALGILIGTIQTQLYVNSSGNKESLEWLKNLKKQIRHNTLRRY